MFLDFSWVAEPTAWGGLGTLILLEVVLGIDNLVFISILSSRLPEDKRRHAFTIGLSLALIMRLGLLSTVAWLIGLTKPWFSLFGYSFTARDIILLIGGLFLLLKGFSPRKRKPFTKPCFGRSSPRSWCSTPYSLWIQSSRP